MGTGANAWGGRSFADVFAGCLSIGLFYCWVNLGGFSGDDIFASLAADRLPHDLAMRLATGVAFLAASFAPRLLSRESVCLVSCVVLAVLSVVVRWCSGVLGGGALIAGAAMAGVALALFLCLWLARYRRDMSGMFVMLLLAAVVTNLLYPAALSLGGRAVDVAVLVFPLFAALLFAFGPAGCGDAHVSAVSSSASKPERLGFALQAAALLLCNFASGPAAYGMAGSSEGTIQLAAVASLALSLVFVFRRQPRDEALLAFFALVVCACIAPMLALKDLPAWLPSLCSAGFWVITKYSLAWFCFHGSMGCQGLSVVSLRGFAAVYLLTAVAELVGVNMQGQVACVVALVTVGVALAVALINATRVSAPSALGAAGRDVHELPSDQSPREGGHVVVPLDGLADRFSLTEGERGVFACLSKGYSLRQVAKELGITEGTAKYHRHNVYQKLGVASREELIELVEREARGR